VKSSSCRLLAAVVSVLTLAVPIAALDTSAGRAGTPAVLWRDPAPIGSLDLTWGNGAAARAPRGPFQLVEEIDGGTQPKVLVTDARGTVWDVKFGKEARAEVAATRIVWALGYLVQEVYFVRQGVVQGSSSLERAGDHIGADGRFEHARFRRRDPSISLREDSWSFAGNPFLGRRELSGLVILMTMINNWDIDGERNNGILEVTAPDGSRERQYIVMDLGASFGRMGGLISDRSKWNLGDFLAEGFIQEVGEGTIEFDYDGLDGALEAVPLDHARWFAGLAGQLRPAQLRAAFEAAGATREEVDGFSRKLAGKIAMLQRVTNGPR
jgi:hypothetical protein